MFASVATPAHGFPQRETSLRASIPLRKPNKWLAIPAQKTSFFVRVSGIEPESRPWQGRILPLNHTRNVLIYSTLRVSETRGTLYKNTDLLLKGYLFEANV